MAAWRLPSRDAIYQRFAELLREEARPDGEIQRGLAERYVGDPRFAANLDKLAPGLAQFVHDAIASAVTQP